MPVTDERDSLNRFMRDNRLSFPRGMIFTESLASLYLCRQFHFVARELWQQIANHSSDSPDPALIVMPVEHRTMFVEQSMLIGFETLDAKTRFIKRWHDNA